MRCYICTAIIVLLSFTGLLVDAKSIRQAEVREETFNDKIHVRWENNFEKSIISFRVTAQTTGFVGFGVSPNGGMAGADLVIGGVYPNGTHYFKDYHATSNSAPTEDAKQDWHLISFNENLTHTVLQFYRSFDTCDNDDNRISEDSTYFIWSYGETDDIQYHGVNRGQSAVNILDPPMPPVDVSSFERWDVKRRMVMPANDTSYFCTIHKRPKFEGKHHIVGFDSFIPSPEALKHTHHITISQCITPPGQDADEVFGPYLGFPGEECYERPSVMPMDYCFTIVYVWAVGGKITLFPENVGLPTNEPGNENEYFLMEVHYDNPDRLTDVEFETGVTIYHTDNLREEEAALLIISHDIFMTHIIPPRSVNYTTVGHCSPECLTERIPETGIQLFNILLHSHLAGRKLKLRHWRDGVELPWVANDDMYNFDFQQNRPIRNERTILPGDQLAYECVTDTSDREHATMAGLSTRHEMCEAIIWYYPRQNFLSCSSAYMDLDKIYEQFGIEELTWDYDNFDPTVVSPAAHAGKLFSQVLNDYPWTAENKAVLEHQLRYSNHMNECYGQFDDWDARFALRRSIMQRMAKKQSRT